VIQIRCIARFVRVNATPVSGLIILDFQLRCNGWNNHVRIGEEGSDHCDGYSEGPVLLQGNLHGRRIVGSDVSVRGHLGSDHTGTLWAIFASALLEKFNERCLLLVFYSHTLLSLENNLRKTYNSCVWVEWLFGRSFGRYEVVPGIGVPTASAASVNLIAVDKLLFAVTYNKVNILDDSTIVQNKKLGSLTSVKQRTWFYSCTGQTLAE
jgi:hypothetical protein